MRKIELLAPARNLTCGLEAVKHGADAVYIGGPSFGARSAAANSIEDIAELCRQAHIYGVKVYVALNTIIKENELKEAVRVINALYAAKVDALIVQDLALLRLDLPPIALHASTQMDNRTADKVKFLQNEGLTQVVLARELSLREIRQIHDQTDVSLEAFVHGALCVSYSGRCYASQHCFGRSANRGECAQFCRMAFDLTDHNDRPLLKERHLLSLKDMCRIDHLEAMLDAGVSSFKIEGRLKDVAYVKNVTAAYRQALDAIIVRRSDEFCRSSFGSSAYTFTPQLTKSFNRGFTDYFLTAPTPDMANHATPKSIGEPIGQTTRAVKGRVFDLLLHKDTTLSAGDGLCFIDEKGRLQGFRLNRCEGSRCFAASEVNIPRTLIYRNHDAAFERLLASPTATRTMWLDFILGETENGYSLTAKDEMGFEVTASADCLKEEARSEQAEQCRRQLSKLGGTPFTLRRLDINLLGNRFIPASVLAGLRRQAIELLLEQHITAYHTEQRPPRRSHTAAEARTLVCSPSYQANVANSVAERLFESLELPRPAKAFELSEPAKPLIMTCRYCLRRELHCCLKTPQGRAVPGPLSLRLADGRKFSLKFDCAQCQMQVYAE